VDDRTLTDKLPEGVQAKAKAALNEIYEAETKAAVEEAFDLFVATYEAKFPKAAECPAKDREALLAFYDFPTEHSWRGASGWRRQIRERSPLSDGRSSTGRPTPSAHGSGFHCATDPRVSGPSSASTCAPKGLLRSVGRVGEQYSPWMGQLEQLRHIVVRAQTRKDCPVRGRREQSRRREIDLRTGQVRDRSAVEHQGHLGLQQRRRGEQHQPVGPVGDHRDPARRREGSALAQHEQRDQQVAHPLGAQRAPRRQKRRADLPLAVGVELAAVGGRGPPDAHRRSDRMRRLSPRPAGPGHPEVDRRRSEHARVS
jgi:hypothetical protein